MVAEICQHRRGLEKADEKQWVSRKQPHAEKGGGWEKGGLEYGTLVPTVGEGRGEGRETGGTRPVPDPLPSKQKRKLAALADGLPTGCHLRLPAQRRLKGKSKTMSSRLEELENELRQRNAEIEARRRKVLEESLAAQAQVAESKRMDMEEQSLDAQMAAALEAGSHSHRSQRPHSAFRHDRDLTFLQSRESYSQSPRLAAPLSGRVATDRPSELPSVSSPATAESARVDAGNFLRRSHDESLDPGMLEESAPRPGFNVSASTFDNTGILLSPRKGHGLPPALSASSSSPGGKTAPAATAPLLVQASLAADPELLSAVDSMPVDAALRFHKARSLALEAELQTVVASLQAKDEELHSIRRDMKALRDDYMRLQKTHEHLKAKSEKFDARVEGERTEAEKARQMLGDERRAREAAEKDQKRLENELAAKDVRINRLAEEVDKYKNMLKNMRSTSAGVADDSAKRIERLTQENKRLERVKGELVGVVKKQMKLIDLIKRQKVHVEAARLLAFNEDEFAKLLEYYQ